ncbi:hypothetical protein M0804_000203 [Polistes exclamans]|nr:hypothetical protein M0804_000203 [Polistes exclamans]
MANILAYLYRLPLSSACGKRTAKLRVFDAYSTISGGGGVGVGVGGCENGTESTKLAETVLSPPSQPPPPPPPSMMRHE